MPVSIVVIKHKKNKCDLNLIREMPQIIYLRIIYRIRKNFGNIWRHEYRQENDSIFFAFLRD